MPTNDLAAQLRADIDRAAPGYKVVAIHLFGIKHEPDLRHVSLPELVGEAGVQKSYAVDSQGHAPGGVRPAEVGHRSRDR